MTDPTAILIIVALAAVTYLARAGGLIIMSVLPVTSRTEAFLDSLSSSVMVAIVVPAMLTGDTGAVVGVGVVFFAMITTKNMLIAMTAGVVVAALVRASLGA